MNDFNLSVIYMLVRSAMVAYFVAIALQFLAGQLAGAANCFSFFTNALFGRLFVMATKLHFAEDAFTLHLFLQRFQRLIDIVVTDENLHVVVPLPN